MTIQEAVAEQIVGSGDSVKNIVISKLVAVEIDRRVATVTKALSLQEDMEKGLKKISKNDIINYMDGQAVEAMSKQRYDQINQETDKLKRLTEAIDLALSSNTVDAYNKLTEMVKKVKDDLKRPFL